MKELEEIKEYHTKWNLREEKHREKIFTKNIELHILEIPKILDSLKIVDTLCFGCETADFAALNNIANVLYNEPKEYVALLNHELSKGLSYPKA